MKKRGDTMSDLDFTKFRSGSELLKRGFARMQQGGVIMDVVNAEQALSLIHI